MDENLPMYKLSTEEDVDNDEQFDSVRDEWLSDKNNRSKVTIGILTGLSGLFLITTILSLTVFKDGGGNAVIPPETITQTATTTASQKTAPIVPPPTITETQFSTETVTETQRRDVIIDSGNTDSPTNTRLDAVPPNYVGNGVSTNEQDQVGNQN